MRETEVLSYLVDLVQSKYEHSLIAMKMNSEKSKAIRANNLHLK